MGDRFESRCSTPDHEQTHSFLQLITAWLNRVQVAIVSTRTLIKAIERIPKEWGLDVIAMFGPFNYGKRKIAW